MEYCVTTCQWYSPNEATPQVCEFIQALHGIASELQTLKLGRIALELQALRESQGAECPVWGDWGKRKTVKQTKLGVCKECGGTLRVHVGATNWAECPKCGGKKA